MADITVAKLKEILKDYSDDCTIMCGFEGLSFYKVGSNSCIGKFDFGNEKSRMQRVFYEKDHLEDL